VTFGSASGKSRQPFRLTNFLLARQRLGDENGPIKNLSRTTIYLSLGAAVVWVVGCACWEFGSCWGESTLPYDEKSAEIKPGSEVSKNYRKEVMDILNQYAIGFYAPIWANARKP
jgi:hypothetical protein